MKLYEISDSYLDYLKSFDDRVLNRLGEKYRHTRKYLGILLRINDCDYIAPLSSPSQTDYLNGAISKLGKKHNIQTPVCDAVTLMIHAKEFIRGNK